MRRLNTACWIATAIGVGIAPVSARAQRASPVCFSGVARSACSGFILLEASAANTWGSKHTIVTMLSLPTGPVPFQRHLEDLPRYYSGGVGYVHMVGPVWALGIAGELGNANPDAGTANRMAITARARHWTSNVALDLGAGPLSADIFTPAPNGTVDDRLLARGATVEAAVSYKSLLGVVVGVDAIRGANRRSSAIRVGIRTGSYGTLVAAAITAVAGAFVLAGLAGGLEER